MVITMVLRAITEIMAITGTTAIMEIMAITGLADTDTRRDILVVQKARTSGSMAKNMVKNMVMVTVMATMMIN